MAVARRVVVTGMGSISPLGNDLPTTWANAVVGKSGIGPIRRFDVTAYKTRIAAEVKDYNPQNYFPAKEARRMDLFAQYALVAAREALHGAGLTFEQGRGARTAVVIGSGIGGIGTTSEQVLLLNERGPSRVSPFLVPMILPETPASLVAIEFGIKGPNMAVTSACASGANAIGEAYEMIRRGVVDAAICGGTEAGIVPIAVAAFSVMHALSERNDEPERASRPFDHGRDGFVIGEGSAILVIEALEQARARGATIHAELVGYGSTDDAFHITAPDQDGAGATACMRQALDSAGMAPEEIGYINAHGTSTPLNDATETHAIKTVFGQYAYKLPVSSTKSMTGHLLGASGALEAVLSIQALQENLLPPTINLEEPDPACDLDYVPRQARPAQIRAALSNSFGFGGHNACLIFRKLEEA